MQVVRWGWLACALVWGAGESGAAQSRVTIGRLQYDGGGDWYANPSSLPNLLKEIGLRTTIPVESREVALTLSDARLWDVPYLYLTGHGNLRWSEAELVTLRRYLARGGFLHIDDSYGMDESVRREVLRLYPENPLVEVPLEHPIYRVVYPFPRGLPKIHEHDNKPAQGFGIFLDGRLVLFYSYQSDLGDGWEDPQVHRDSPAVRDAAIRMGVNLVAYAVGFAR